MKVERIFLNGWRNYEMATADFSAGVNVISGKNAQGKTNLLEAVYMLTGGRSFRTRFDRELIGFDFDSGEILADVEAAGRRQTVRIVLRRGQRKSITLNGVKKTGTELSDSLKAVLFCPADLNVIKEGAQERRRLMDAAISQLRPGYAALLSEYARLYEHKSRILRDWREKPDLLDLLDDFSQSMCRVSAQLVRYRASYCARLAEEAADVHRDFSGGAEALGVEYRTVSTVTDPRASLQQVTEEIYAHQAAHRQAELDSMSCLTGAHKDDLYVTIGGRGAREFASQGQARTAALSLKLAEREIFLDETGEYPVLLLDDVLSELDSRRRDFVLNRIGGGQTLITCCEDEEISQKTGGRVLFIENGGIRR
jgi:DNA replication and repair protein RecF